MLHITAKRKSTMNPYLTKNKFIKGFFLDQAVENVFSTKMTLEYYKKYEIALTEVAERLSLIDTNLALETCDAIKAFQPDMQKIEDFLFVDGLAIPEFVRQLKRHAGNKLKDCIHIGATSQDIMDTALVLAIRDANNIIEDRLESLCSVLDSIIDRFGENVIDGRTRMQKALLIQANDRIITWKLPLIGYLNRLLEIRTHIEVAQVGGPVGTRQFPPNLGEMFASEVASSLGLSGTQKAWHTMRSNLTEYANFLSMITGSLGKIGLDLSLMSQQGVDEVTFMFGGSSSAMAHKKNPVLPEVLTSLADFNAVQLPGMHLAMLHEQERSGRAWTLEWMIFPGMLNTTARALSIALTTLGGISHLGKERP